jgi:protein-tyrosine phosphatase
MFSFFRKKVFLKDLLPGFTDIHCHLLPGIDDGAKDPEHSLELISGFRDLGISSFIASPHIMDGTYPNNDESIEKASEILRKKLIGTGMDFMFSGAAAEYMLDHSFESMVEQGLLRPVYDNYILVEMSYYRPPERLEQILFKVLNAGYKPILAHPERYLFALELEDIQKFRTLGCLFQLNLLSLGRQYGPRVQKSAKKLLDKGWYEFAGTDTHHLKHIEKIGKLEVSQSAERELKNVLNRNKLFSGKQS